MIEALMTILYILLFIVCLSLLIIVHEAGHLAAAKAFNVFCLEYSIGFGPALFHKKRKNGETYFSIRGIPFGGYVSMYGEGIELPDGVVVDSKRSLEGIKKWKRAIILIAGVTMNAILALILFTISETCFSQTLFYGNEVKVAENSIAETVGIKSDDIIKVEEFSNVYVIDRDAKAYFSDGVESTIVALQRQLTSKNELSWDIFLHFYKSGSVDFQNGTLVYKTEDPNVEINANYEKLEHIDFTLTILDKPTSEGEDFTERSIPLSLPVEVKDGKRSLKSLGISIYSEEYWQSFPVAMKQVFVDFGDASTAIVRGLGSLFTTPDTWQQMGGMVAIGFETTSILKNFGLSDFIRIWGLISVNLAIINLIPFPGLDGWQLLVVIVEGISRKKIPEKVKNIVSFVGLAILFVLMILILFKDVFTYIF